MVEMGLAAACPRLCIVLLAPWRQLDWMPIGHAFVEWWNLSVGVLWRRPGSLTEGFGGSLLFQFVWVRDYLDVLVCCMLLVLLG